VGSHGLARDNPRLLFLVPFQYYTVHYSADLEEFFLVMYHVGAREAGDGVIFAQINRLLGTNFLAHPAINAADHVDIEFFRKFFYLGEMVCRRNLTGNNFDCPRRTDELAKLTRDTAHPPIRIAHQGWGAAIMIRQVAVPFLLGILHRHLGASEQHIFEMLKRNCQAGRNGWEIQSLAPVQSRSWNGNGHEQKDE
jgi:hypothetical protein